MTNIYLPEALIAIVRRAATLAKIYMVVEMRRLAEMKIRWATKSCKLWVESMMKATTIASHITTMVAYLHSEVPILQRATRLKLVNSHVGGVPTETKRSQKCNNSLSKLATQSNWHASKLRPMFIVDILCTYMLVPEFHRYGMDFFT